MNGIPLSRAYLCLDCDVVVELGARCPQCGREAGWSLARWLDRLEHALIEGAEGRLAAPTVSPI